MDHVFQHYTDHGMSTRPQWAAVQAKRGPKRMLYLERQRARLVAQLLSKGTAPAVAEILIPRPEPFGLTVVRADARGAYRRMKRAYTRRSR